jgi:hypothetical protein
METKSKQAVNGVDVGRLYETIEAVQGNPALAPSRWTWTEADATGPGPIPAHPRYFCELG